MSKHKQPGGIWTAQYAHCAVLLERSLNGPPISRDPNWKFKICKCQMAMHINIYKVINVMVLSMR